MKNVSLLSLAILFGATVAEANLSSYKLLISRNGNATTQVASNFWSGEWPGPVIDVNAKVSGQTKIEGFASLRLLNEKKSCTINNAIYHPWSEAQKNSVLEYYQLHSIQDYAVVAALNVDTETGDTMKLKKGSSLDNVTYLGENLCSATATQGTIKKEVTFGCDELESKSLVLTRKTDTPTEQWLYVKCAEGYKVFVQDESLLAQPGVKKGTFLGYGKVGSEGDSIPEELNEVDESTPVVDTSKRNNHGDLEGGGAPRPPAIKN